MDDTIMMLKRRLTKQQQQQQQQQRPTVPLTTRSLAPSPPPVPHTNHHHRETSTTTATRPILNRRIYPHGCLKRSPDTTTTTTTTTATTTTVGNNRGNPTTTTTAAAAPSSSSSSSRQQQRHPPKKQVSFQEVYIREFERILGDNPSCSSGAPISLGWNYAMDQSLPIDDYEARSAKYSRRTRPTSNQNQNQNDTTRTKRPDELILSRHDRETLLYEWGVTFPEMIEAIRSNVKIKNQRRRTVHAIGTYDRIEEMMEITAHKWKFGKSKKNCGNHHATASIPPAAATQYHSKPPPRQQPQKRAILLHSNHATNDSKDLSLLVRSSSGSSGSSRDNHSFGSDSDGKVSNYSLHSAASTNTSASHVAICCDNDDNNKNKCGDPTPITVVTMPMDHPDTQSEVNDLSSPVPTPVSSSVMATTTTTSETNDNDDENIVVHAKCNPTVTTNGKHDKNDMNHHHTAKNDETAMVLTDVATEAKEPPPSRKFHRSRSFDNDRHDNDDTPRNLNMYPMTESRRPATQLVALKPIIGVDIPRDVQLLQRSISVESGLTDHNKYDSSMGHHQNEPTDGDNDNVSTLAYDVAEQYELTERSEDVADETMNDDMTIPSKFIREFNELMMEDSHPKLRNLTPPVKVSPTSEMHDGNTPHHRPSSSPRPADTHGGRHDDDDDDIDANYNHHHHNTSNKSMTTEDDDIYLHWAAADHPLSPISELTGGDRLRGSFCSRSTASSYMYRRCHPEDGNFDTLQRDSSFWGIRPDEPDGPQIQRIMVPVVISEEDVSVGESAIDHLMNEPHQLFDITENQPYDTMEEYVRRPVEHNMHAKTTDIPTMMHSNNIALPSTHVFSQHRETQYPLPSVLPTLRTVSGIPPSPPPVGSIPVLQPHQQHNSINTGSMHLHSGDGPYPPPKTFPSVLLLHPSPTMRSPTVPPNIVESSLLVPPDEEAMYNIEQNVQQPHVYAVHHHPDNISSQHHHASTYHQYPPPTVVDQNVQNGTSTTIPPPWHDFGFRSSMEPPPNSTTLFHKMMM